MTNEKKTVLVRNRSNRNYNGIQPWEIKEVASEYLDSYLQAWFEHYKSQEVEGSTDESNKAPANTNKANTKVSNEVSEEELKDRRDFLVNHWVVKAKQYQKPSRIIEESDALGYKKVEAPATSPSDLSDLDDPTKVIADAEAKKGTSDVSNEEEEEEIVD